MNTHAQTWKGHVGATVSLGIPLIGSHMAQMLTHTTDIVMLGWYSVDALAATVLATQFFFIIFIVGSGFAFAVMPLVANAAGEDDIATVRRSVRMGIWISMIYGVFALIPLWFLGTILKALGQDAALSEVAQTYMRIAVWGMFPALMIMVFKSYLSALERAQIVLIATVLGALINAVFNYAFIFGNWGMPELGVRGAAWASVVTTLFAFTILWVYAAVHPALKRFTLFVRLWRPDWAAMGEVFRLGYPIGLTLLAETGLFTASTLMMGLLGTVALATHGIVLQIASISFMIPLGLSNVATIRAGRAMGRKDYDNLRKGSIVVTLVALGFALTAMALFFAIPETLVRLFLDETADQVPEIIAYGIVLLAVAGLFQVADSMQVIALGLLRGIKETFIPSVMAIVSYWVIGVPFAYILGIKAGFGGIGIWGGLVVGLICAAVSMSWLYLRRLKTLSHDLR